MRNSFAVSNSNSPFEYLSLFARTMCFNGFSYSLNSGCLIRTEWELCSAI